MFLFLQTTRKSNLVQHKLTHSKEKPHQCEICGQSFSLAKNMRRHARQHDQNATIFKCKVNNCVFKSLRSDKYIEHMKKYHPAQETPEAVEAVTEVTTAAAAAAFAKTETKVIKSENNSSLLTTSPFNTVSPPNKTVSDTYDSHNTATASVVASPSGMMDDSQLDEALILAAATASEEDITNLVTPLLS